MRPTLFAASLLAASLGAGAAMAGPNLVENGTFATTTYGSTNSEFGTGYTGATQGVTDWTGNGGYNIFFNTATDTTLSATSQYSGGKEMLWSNPSTAGLPAGTSITQFVALDGDPSVSGGISQTIAATLVTGALYTVTFDWAAGQLQSETGPTTEQVKVSLGTSAFAGQSFLTSVVDNASEGSVGWMQASFTFMATAATEVLSFLAIGTPTGLPPMVLLSNVSMTVAVPEPISLSVLGAGLIGLASARRRRPRA